MFSLLFPLLAASQIHRRLYANLSLAGRGQVRAPRAPMWWVSYEVWVQASFAISQKSRFSPSWVMNTLWGIFFKKKEFRRQKEPLQSNFLAPLIAFGK